MIDQEQLEFVRDVLDDTLISGEVNGSRVLTALEIVADALQDGDGVAEVQEAVLASGDNNDGDSTQVPSTSGQDEAVPTLVEPVEADGPDYGSDSA